MRCGQIWQLISFQDMEKFALMTSAFAFSFVKPSSTVIGQSSGLILQSPLERFGSPKMLAYWSVSCGTRCSNCQFERSFKKNAFLWISQKASLQGGMIAACMLSNRLCDGRQKKNTLQTNRKPVRSLSTIQICFRSGCGGSPPRMNIPTSCVQLWNLTRSGNISAAIGDKIRKLMQWVFKSLNF